MNKTILLTVTGAVSADIAIKSFKRMGFRIVGCDSHPKAWIVGSNEVDAFYQAPLINDGEKYISFIIDICKRENVAFIVPMIDIEIDLFSKHRKWFDENGVILCMCLPETVDILRNKKKLADFIKANCPDINSIPTVYLKDIKELEWDFPVVCKPYNGRSSQGLRYIYNKEEWEEFKSSADKNLYIVEPFIEGPICMVEIVRQTNPHKVVAMCRRELMSTPHGLSTSVYIYQNKSLEERCKVLADKLNILGNVNFEFILDPEGEYHFVECNPRFSAGCEFSCLGGYDVAENMIRSFMGVEIDDYCFKHTMVVARHYEEIITAVGIDEPYCKTYHS